ncbi:hypothetical protein E2C01_089710 [Portunus trituberculatus]|uniref:Uncharacterized protein n=1 Tax=Portunus trituberculatus TaxID=210409 RepID=A0A5B7JN68_PORTR|nr:hypothetical protein [Portunus trituberculatus]
MRQHRPLSRFFFYGEVSLGGTGLDTTSEGGRFQRAAVVVVVVVVCCEIMFHLQSWKYYNISSRCICSFPHV